MTDASSQKVDDPAQWPAVMRVVWLVGGCVVLHRPGERSAHLCAGFDGPSLRTYPLASYGALASLIRATGARAVGMSIYSEIEEFAGLIPTAFRSFARPGGQLVNAVWTTWRHIVNAAWQAESMVLLDLASRVAAGLFACERRLEQLARAYSAQLRAIAVTKELVDYRRFHDMNSPAIYLAVHALFWELAVLRDVMAEYVAKVLLNAERVDSFGGLLKLLRGDAITHPLRQELLDAGSSPNGWIDRFTQYRNLFTHSAPMDQATGRAFAVQDWQVTGDAVKLPYLYYPLPANAQVLQSQRKAGPLFGSAEELIQANKGRRPDRKDEPDALDYLADVVQEVALLCGKLGDHSPLAPKPVVLTDEDVIGPIKVTRK